ncbi:hypothetical protein Hanom_Chr13g01205661 [Helianthus anomalus]
MRVIIIWFVDAWWWLFYTAMAIDSGNGRFGVLGFCCFCQFGRTLYLIFV